MELDVLGSGRHILAQRTVIVLHATIQHLHRLEVRLNVVVNFVLLTTGIGFSIMINN